MDVPTPKNNTELERLIEHFKHVPPKGDEDAYGYYQNIAMNILQKGEETGNTSLLDILKEKPTPEQMRAIVLAIPFSVYQELPEVYQRISAILMEALEAENPRVIAEAVFGLNVLRQGDLAEHLKLLLEHSSPYVRQEVLRYLSVYYPDNGVPLNSLVECFKKDEPEGDVTYYLDAANLIRAQGRAGIDFLFDYYHESPKIIQKTSILLALSLPLHKLHPGSESVDREMLVKLLFKQLDEEDPEIIGTAVDGLRIARVNTAVERVLDLMEHPSSLVKAGVLHFMARMEPQRAFSMLLEATKSPDWIIRSNAADALGEMEMDHRQRAEALDVLRGLLEDKHPLVQDAAQLSIPIVEDDEDNGTAPSVGFQVFLLDPDFNLGRKKPHNAIF